MKKKKGELIRKERFMKNHYGRQNEKCKENQRKTIVENMMER